MEERGDREILRRVRQGDHSAFLTLFDRYYTAIERYARCLSQDPSSAAAAAEATFVTAFREARRRPEAQRYPAYLFRVCRRMLLRRCGERRLSAYQERADAPDCGSLVDLPLSIILRPERDALVQSALECLLLEDREVIHLAFEPDLSREDLRPILKLSSDEAVNSRLVRALRRLGMAVVQAGYVAPAQKGGPLDCVKRWART